MENISNQIQYFCYDTLFGEMLLANSSKGICYACFLREKEAALAEFRNFFRLNDIIEQQHPIQKRALEAINEQSTDSTQIALDIIGTDFQKTVWQALLQIPFGETSTYKEIACKIGKPKAVRAVGTAIGRNKLSILIPCHRVVGSSGKLVGYKWGIDLKEKILEKEKTKA